MLDASCKHPESNNQAEVLALDEPVSPALRTIRRRVGHQHEGLAEATLRLIPTLAVPHMSTDHKQHRHVLDGHLVGCFDAGSGDSRVCAVDDLAVKGLDFVVCGGHLVDKDVLHSSTIRHGVAVEENCRRGGGIEGADGVAVLAKSWIEGLDELGGG